MNRTREDITMKKLLVFILALCLVTGLCGCQVITKDIIERDATAADDTTLYEHGMELAELLEEMLGSPEYFEMMSGSERLNEVIQPLMGAGLAQPESAYLVTLSEDALPLLMDAAEVDMDQFSDRMQEFLARKMTSSVPSILNSRQGADTLAAASILTVSDAWAGENLELGCYLILNYPDFCPVMVSFWGGDGLIEGTAAMLIGEPLEEDSIEGVRELFSYLDAEGMHIKKLETD